MKSTVNQRARDQRQAKRLASLTFPEDWRCVEFNDGEESGLDGLTQAELDELESKGRPKKSLAK